MSSAAVDPYIAGGWKITFPRVARLLANVLAAGAQVTITGVEKCGGFGVRQVVPGEVVRKDGFTLVGANETERFSIVYPLRTITRYYPPWQERDGKGRFRVLEESGGKRSTYWISFEFPSAAGFPARDIGRELTG